MNLIKLEKAKKEKVFIVVIDYKKNHKPEWPAKEILSEMEELVIACGGEVMGSMISKEEKPSARCLIGEGKVKMLTEELTVHDGIDTVIFSEDLKGNQQRNLEDEIKVKTIDRTQLILDIFARRATTREGKTQVELAQLEYLKPRLVGKGVELSRLGGGIGTLGPGETKLEMDRRRIDQRIDNLRKELREISANRLLKKKKRIEKHIPSISLIGYTNAGKTTLLNTLTNSTQLTRDSLFTTLESLSRQLVLPNNHKVIISDTVGFMHDLPHHLIESFKATLEEVKEADLLLHVLDISNPKFRQFHNAVMNVLEELRVKDKPILTILNKIDKLEDKHWLSDIKDNFKPAVYASALKSENIDGILNEIENLLSYFNKEINIAIPLNRMDLVNLIHEHGQVLSIQYTSELIKIRAVVPSYLAPKFDLKFQNKNNL